MIDFDNVLSQLQRDGAEIRDTSPAGQSLRRQNQTRQTQVGELAAAFNDPSAMQAFDAGVDARYRSATQSLGQQVNRQRGRTAATAANRGQLGSSGQARRQAGSQAAMQSGIERQAQVAEQTRQRGRDDRAQQASQLLQMILSPQGLNAAAGQTQIGGAMQAGENAEALADLDFAQQQIASQVLGSILSDAGQFGAAGYNYANRHNEAHPGATATWFDFGV